jgi:tryptophan-rich sensory protein
MRQNGSKLLFKIFFIVLGNVLAWRILMLLQERLAEAEIDIYHGIAIAILALELCSMLSSIYILDMWIGLG